MNNALSKNLNTQFASFLDTHPPEQFSASLRRMLLEYMSQNMDSGVDIDFSKFLLSLSDFFDLLDEAALEQPKQDMPPAGQTSHKGHHSKPAAK